jgi:hydrogenase maturation protease
MRAGQTARSASPSDASAARSILVIGLGNAYRSDDGAGLAVARRLRATAPPGIDVEVLEGEPLALLDMWEGAAEAYVVDAVVSDAESGTVHRFDAIAEPPPAAFRNRGTHTFSVAEVVELARALGNLPGRLVVYGIEGEVFGAGTGLSEPVEAAVVVVEDRLRRDLEAGGP